MNWMQSKAAAFAVGASSLLMTAPAHAKADGDKQDDWYLRATNIVNFDDQGFKDVTTELKSTQTLDNGVVLYLKGQVGSDLSGNNSAYLKAAKAQIPVDHKTLLSVGHIFGDEAFGRANEFDKYRGVHQLLYKPKKSITGVSVERDFGNCSLTAMVGKRFNALNRNLIGGDRSKKKKPDENRLSAGGRIDCSVGGLETGVHVFNDENSGLTDSFAYLGYNEIYAETLLRDGEFEHALLKGKFKAVMGTKWDATPAAGYNATNDNAFGSLDVGREWKNKNGSKGRIGLSANTQKQYTASFIVSF